MGRLIEYYFSLNSPWTYMGGARLAALAARHGARVAVRPMNLGTVFHATGGLPLAKRPPARQAYRLVELSRWSTFLGLPLIVQPPFFPVDETEAALLVVAAEKAGLDALSIATAFGRVIWERGQNLADAAVIDVTLAEVGLDAADLRQRFSRAELVAAQEENTQAALARGVFGAPSYVLDGELFWGQDRLDFLERALAT
jgi:2-hydroxychromene-2-carboxylate isomerase